MAFIVNEAVEEYAAEHTTQPRQLFERLAEETREKTTAPQMMVGRIEGGFLAAIVGLTGAKRILELGTFTGYSSISWPRPSPTTDESSRATSTRRRPRLPAGTWTRAATETRSRSASAPRSTRSPPSKARSTRLHRRRQAELPGVLRGRASEVADNGLVIADNVLWSGRVVQPDGDESTEAIKSFNEHVEKDDRVVSVMLTVRDGMTLVQR